MISLNRPPDDPLYEIETNGNCINIYSKENCIGDYIRLQTTVYFTVIQNMSAHRWEGNVLVGNENITVSSIRECFDYCFPWNWHRMREEIPVSVTLYDLENYMGNSTNSTTLTISRNECIPVTPVKTWRSIKIPGTALSSCIQLHADASCGGNSVQLQPGYPNLQDLWWWGFYDGLRPAEMARSVSLCGYTCPDGEIFPVPTVRSRSLTKSTTPRTIISTTTKNYTTMPTIESKNLHVGDTIINLHGAEQPWNLPMWAVFLIILAILLLSCVSGLGGGCILQWVRNMQGRSSGEHSKSRADNI
ncbi:hypothetical protein Fcan01_26505 [Folsomia candida]|uniref:Uncharacterized protein n=2 Tax=Folsomia candida TaxID=158441 RepID=A0A226D3F8_FOLCA|nr:hypothetical protein Fcan01_26505 [Folsomia candida]